MGGYIIANLSWRMLFYISAPIGVIGVILGVFLLEEMPRNPLGKFDMIGFITSTIGLVCVFFVLGKWTHINWREMHYPLILAVGICALILFVINELMHPSPLLDLKILGNYTFSAWLAISALLSMAMIGISYLVPIFLQNIMGYTAMQTGLILLPAAIGTAMVMPFSGKMLDKHGYKAVMIPGMILFTAVSYPLSFLNTDTSSMMIITLLVVRGMALGLIITPPSTMAMQGIPKPQISQASAVQNIIRQLASTLSVTLITVTLQSQITLNGANLSEQLSSMNPLTMDAVKTLQGLFMSSGLSASDAGTAAGTALGGMIQKMAYVSAIDYILSAMLFLSMGLLIGIIFLEKPKQLWTVFRESSKSEEAIGVYGK